MMLVFLSPVAEQCLILALVTSPSFSVVLLTHQECLTPCCVLKANSDNDSVEPTGGFEPPARSQRFHKTERQTSLSTILH